MRIFAWLVTATLLLAHDVRGFDAPDFAFLLTAQASVDASRIVITWPQKNVTSITVHRKLVTEKQWGAPVAELAGNATTFEDTDVQSGVAYEYQFAGRLGEDEERAAYGYICAGIEVPTIEHRGKVALIVDDRFSEPIAEELEQLRKDLIGDGWLVVRHDVSVNATPQSVKALIKADWEADRENMRAVFLIGHVPVPYSGLMNPDMHPEHLGAWPADVYYGEMDGVWTDETITKVDAQFEENNNVPGDGKFDQSEISGEVELEVGRVDMSDLPAFDPRTEVELMRNYLNRNHAFRHGVLRAPARGLIRDNFGIVQNDAPAADAWRGFPALFGADGAREVGPGEFFPTLESEAYLFAFGAGGGDRDKADGVGSTEDFAAMNPKAVFFLLHGSYFGDWNTTDNFLRAALASDGYGLVSIWCSLPHWYFHHLALGETVGFATRLVQNNRDGLYRNDPDYSIGQAHISMMGDPTLRPFIVPPPTNVRAVDGRIEWDSAGEVEGYNVYRGDNFEKVNDGLIKGTSFQVESGVYMVKAVALQRTGSGTFWNLSEGIVVQVENTTTILEPRLMASGEFAFEGRGFAERAYRVESRTPEGSWGVRESGRSGADGLVSYRQNLEETAEFFRVVWE
ncbi:MAG TPA: hypothetical protein VM680_07525 [Verrucomicrobiae bacterium]|nr:hypothetical protein [Verrucomicrobiae bacterium]